MGFVLGGLYCGVCARGPVLWGLCLRGLCWGVCTVGFVPLSFSVSHNRVSLTVYPIIGPLLPIMGYTSTDGPLNHLSPGGFGC